MRKNVKNCKVEFTKTYCFYENTDDFLENE